jgi:tRNA-dihydrouridine synthase A
MMNYTDRHERYFLRLLSRYVRLYTGMITAEAIVHGDYKRLLQFSPVEHPLALQLGGSNPDLMAQAADHGAAFGFDEININAGCPSNRAQSGQFGACLMIEPKRVAACVRAIVASCSLPVTVKTRIGIDDRDSYNDLKDFVELVAESGCTTFIIHARKAWLSRLSPRKNRIVPPLCYDTVYQLKADYPSLRIVLNGGVTNIYDVEVQLHNVDGVMIGREAYYNPYILAEADRRLFDPTSPVRSRHEIVQALLPYVESELSTGTRLQMIARHVLGLFKGIEGGQAWRRYLAQKAHCPSAGVEVIQAALKAVELSRRRLHELDSSFYIEST